MELSAVAAGNLSLLTEDGGRRWRFELPYTPESYAAVKRGLLVPTMQQRYPVVLRGGKTLLLLSPAWPESRPDRLQELLAERRIPFQMSEYVEYGAVPHNVAVWPLPPAQRVLPGGTEW